MSDKDYTPYQQKIIKRYYNNRHDPKPTPGGAGDELYLAEGKKRDRAGKPCCRHAETRNSASADRSSREASQSGRSRKS